MAAADIEVDLSKRDCGLTLFSRQYIGQMVGRVVKIDGVVKKFINSQIPSEDERNSLRDKKVADQKFKHLLTIIIDHCNRDDLQALKTFIDILGETNNVDIAQQLSPIYKERVNNVATLSQLSKEQSLVRDLKEKIRCLKGILEEKERHIESLREENKKLVDHYLMVADDQKKSFREEKLSLEKQIKKSKEDLLFAEKEIGELTRKKNDLENEVELKSNVIRERNKEIVEKDRALRKAIEESDNLRLRIDTLQQQNNEAMVEDKEKSETIEILEDKLAKKEIIIVDLRKNKTMNREDVAEEVGKITKVLSDKIDTLIRSLEEKK